MPEDFDTSALTVHARERIAFAYFDPRGMYGDFVNLMAAGAFLWPFDAEARGYDMAVWRGPWQHVGGRL